MFCITRLSIPVILVIISLWCGYALSQECTDGSVRIVDRAGMESQEGRVEFCHNNEWGAVCDDLWNDTDAMVVCRQLNLSFIWFLPGLATPDGTGMIWLDNVQCRGNEVLLSDCPADPIGSHNCGHDKDAGVVCAAELMRRNCNTGEIRLTGLNNNTGRVEICNEGRWGTVCDDSWDQRDAKVACRQLGHSVDEATAIIFSLGSGEIWLDEVRCAGTETRLIDCRARPIGIHDCNHSEDAGVSCLTAECDSGEIRLRGGTSSTSGRVEICNERRWGTVCDDSWNEPDARVACRQLGYSAEGARGFTSGFAKEAARMKIWLDDVDCAGNETRLIDCPAGPLGRHNCAHTEDAGVSCISVSMATPKLSATSIKPTPSSTTHDKSYTAIPASTPGGTNDVVLKPGNTTSTLAAAIGVTTTITLVIITVTIALAVYFAVTRRSRGSSSLRGIAMGAIYSPEAEDNGGFDNRVYSAAGEQASQVLYAGEGPDVYAALTTNIYDAVSRETDVYVIPACNEEALYSQLTDIHIPHVSRASLKVQEQIGSGQFGTVYKGVWQSPGGGEVEVAVKILKEGSGEEDRVKFLQEAAIMGQFKHRNVVEMHGLITIGEPVLIVLELLKQGDLRKHLLSLREKERVDPHTLLSYCRQVASGMAYLSSKAFVHRDLAARNILVSEDGSCKIADFGMSRDLMDESYYVSHGGMIPVKWTAPEALHYKKYSTASDVWSYGALMYEIWSLGHKPFEGYTNMKVLQMIEKGYRLPPPPGCPREVYKIMIRCWHCITSERPNFTNITEQLSLPDTKLLKWSEEDKSVHPEAAQLGADLLCGEELYKDQQSVYRSTI